MRQPKLRAQWQRITNQKLRELVEFETRRQFFTQYLTDMRVQNILELKSESNIITQDKIIMEMSDYSLNRSLPILKRLKLRPDIAVQVTWDGPYDKIEWFDIVGKASDEFSEYIKEERKIIQPYRFIFIQLQECWPCYYMWLSARIHLILKYTIQNHIFADGRLLEEARHYKYSGETVTDSNGNARIPFNLTGVIQHSATSI